ncbi:MAG TPA: spherulation-specific family 4 protein [Candidatus Baltobacteraceae bacterium]|nr:spherulation-specific family 4 protein [Candidatus Baltobacteraceae bacterium]
MKRFLVLASLFVVASCGSRTYAVGVPSATPATRAQRIAQWHSASSSNLTGVVVPLYVYPGKIWRKAIAAKLAHPNVPMIFIVNVANGPGRKVDSTYVAYVEKAQKAGIDVLGYVYTQYGKRSQTTVEGQMAQWYSYYHTDGIFLDEMAPNDPAYYQTLTAYAHANSLWFVMGNPGVDAPGNSGPDVINFYERAGYPSRSFLKKPAHETYGQSRWSYMAGAVAFNASRIKGSAKYVGYLYATDGKEPECYCRLPSYFIKLVTLLDS